jgi:hypothetical protein
MNYAAMTNQADKPFIIFYRRTSGGQMSMNYAAMTTWRTNLLLFFTEGHLVDKCP